jgi:Holliday junction resolvasome RuvABC endonuclease subunit
MTTILALDLGTTTGWARLNPDQTVISGSQSFAGRRFDGGGMRFLRFTDWLKEVVYTADHGHMVEKVVFEEVRRHAGVDAAHAYGGFLAHLTSHCEARAIPYEGIPVGTIKKFIAGRGNANKRLVIEAVKSHGFNPVDDNEADALALLLYARSINNQT